MIEVLSEYRQRMFQLRNLYLVVEYFIKAKDPGLDALEQLQIFSELQALHHIHQCAAAQISFAFLDVQD